MELCHGRTRGVASQRSIRSESNEYRKVLVFRDVIEEGDDLTIDLEDYHVLIKILDIIKNQPKY